MDNSSPENFYLKVNEKVQIAIAALSPLEHAALSTYPSSEPEPILNPEYGYRKSEAIKYVKSYKARREAWESSTTNERYFRIVGAARRRYWQGLADDAELGEGDRWLLENYDCDEIDVLPETQAKYKDDPDGLTAYLDKLRGAALYNALRSEGMVDEFWAGLMWLNHMAGNMDQKAFEAALETFRPGNNSQRVPDAEGSVRDSEAVG